MIKSFLILACIAIFMGCSIDSPISSECHGGYTQKDCRDKNGNVIKFDTPNKQEYMEYIKK